MMHNPNRVDPGLMDQWLSTLVVILAAMAPVWWLCQQLGHSGWLSLLMLVPLLNIAFLVYWPERSSVWRHVLHRREPSARSSVPVAIAGAQDRRRRAPAAATRRPAAYCSRATRHSCFHTEV